MSPFTGNRIRACHELSPDDNAGPRTGSDDDSKDDLGAGAGAVGGLRHRKTVGVVGDPNGSPQVQLEILLEHLSDEPGRVRVLDAARGGR